MALARIQLGAELDLVTPGELSESEKRVLDCIKGSKYERVRFTPRILAGSAVVSAGATSVQVNIDQSQPAVGRVYNITQLIVLGTDDHTAITGATAVWYAGDDQNPGLATVIKTGMAVPSDVTISKDVVWVGPNDKLFCIVYGLTAGQQIVAIARFRDFKDDDVMIKRL